MRLLVGGVMFTGGIFCAFISVRAGSLSPALIGLGVAAVLVCLIDRVFTPLSDGKRRLLTPARRRTLASLIMANVGSTDLVYGLGSGQLFLAAMGICLLVIGLYIVTHPLDAASGRADDAGAGDHRPWSRSQGRR